MIEAKKHIQTFLVENNDFFQYNLAKKSAVVIVSDDPFS